MVTFVGGAGRDVYYGGNDDDIITGNGGSDYLLGGAGSDSLDGGDGSDILYGGNGDDVILGGAGIDTLDGGIGADNMAGGADGDFYYVDNAGDSVSEDANAGRDLVYSSISYMLTANVEDLTLTGIANLSGAGNDADNVITGNGGANSLTGGLGNDQILGGAGSDILDGGDGNDSLFSNLVDQAFYGLSDTGNEVDTLSGGDGSDRISAGYGDNIDGGGGEDILSISFAGATVGVTFDFSTLASGGSLVIGGGLITGIEQVIDINGSNFADNITISTGANSANPGGFIDASGGGGNDVITGGIGNQYLSGDAGSDTLYGGDGNDILFGNLKARIDNGSDVDTLNGGAGSDRFYAGYGDNIDGGTGNDFLNLNFKGATAGVTVDFSPLGSGSSVVVGGGIITGIETIDTVEGTNFADNITTGNSYAFSEIWVSGEGGDDIVTLGFYAGRAFGGVGNDTLSGSTVGADSLYGDAGDDIIFGKGGNDSISGGDGNDTIDGGTGADTMAGGAGDDIYIVDFFDDIVTEVANEGRDLVLSSYNYMLTANVENLTLTGTATVGVGNDANNVITGNSGANTLNGGLGADILIGGLGADRLDGGGGIDTVSYADSLGAISINLQTGVGTGNAAQGDIVTTVENMIGSAFDDTLIGDGNANRLNGTRGADTMSGAAGADVFVFDTILDSADTITDFVQGTDRIELDQSIFMALGLGTLDTSAFTTGAATTADQHILYDAATGNLSYDADGSGAGSAILFATLQNLPTTITAADFVVVP
ncbi:beta strand repeat-containing protein [Sphingomonas sp.]|uniref:beta strand repeat-containing protein n=1 Tax=Sphingomonas sp. TaxID=28214 RepID=UPI003D6CBFC4